MLRDSGFRLVGCDDEAGPARGRTGSASGVGLAARVVGEGSRVRLPAVLGEDGGRSLFSSDRGGVAVRCLRAGDLSIEMRRAIGAFRLANYVHLGFVDPRLVDRREIAWDPFDPEDTEEIHVLGLDVSTAAIAAYLAFKPPLPVGADVTLSRRDRPLLPVEHMFGAGVFDEVEWMRGLPARRVREVGRFMRNHLDPACASLAARATLAIKCAAVRLSRQTLRDELDAIVGDSRLHGAVAALQFVHVRPIVLTGPIPHLSEEELLHAYLMSNQVFPFAVRWRDMQSNDERLTAMEAALDLTGRSGVHAMLALSHSGVPIDLHASSLIEDPGRRQLELGPEQRAAIVSEARHLASIGGEHAGCEARIRERLALSVLREGALH